MTTEFSNEDVQRVMSKLLSRIQESDKAFSQSLPTSDSLSKLPNTEETLTTEDSPLKSKTIKPKEFIDITLARMNEKKLKSQEKEPADRTVCVQVNVAVLLGAPRERAETELKAGLTAPRMRLRSRVES